MAAIELTFIVLSAVLLLYLLNARVTKKRVPLVTELAYLLVYAVSTLFFFFPRLFLWINVNFGVQLALNLILVLAVFGLFATCVKLYQKLDHVRQEITNLTRAVALLEPVKKKK